MNIYVGNLGRELSEAELKTEFEVYGKVESVVIIKDKISGESRGFGFVEMPDKVEAQAAINTLNGKEIHGKILTVNEARPRTENRRGGGGRNSGGFRGGQHRTGGGGRRF